MLPSILCPSSVLPLRLPLSLLLLTKPRARLSPSPPGASSPTIYRIPQFPHPPHGVSPNAGQHSHPKLRGFRHWLVSSQFPVGQRSRPAAFPAIFEFIPLQHSSIRRRMPLSPLLKMRNSRCGPRRHTAVPHRVSPFSFVRDLCQTILSFTFAC